MLNVVTKAVTCQAVPKLVIVLLLLLTLSSVMFENIKKTNLQRTVVYTEVKGHGGHGPPWLKFGHPTGNPKTIFYFSHVSQLLLFHWGCF